MVSMPQDKLPLFPLGVVLFPGGALPLHIFEERYRELIGEALEAKSEFGVVYASEKGMASVGCTGVVEQVLKKYPDGRMDILVRGRRRFEILLLNEERSFLQGAVDFVADEEGTENLEGETGDLLRQRVLSAWTNLMMLENGGLSGDLPDPRRPDFSFVVADVLPDVEMRQVVLSMRSERERLEALASFVPGYVEKEKRVRHVRRVAPLNGHGKHLVDV
jgi:Lon protease-like protein